MEGSNIVIYFVKLVWILALFCTFTGKLSPVDSNNSAVKAQKIYKYGFAEVANTHF